MILEDPQALLLQTAQQFHHNVKEKDLNHLLTRYYATLYRLSCQTSISSSDNKLVLRVQSDNIITPKSKHTVKKLLF